MKHFPSLLLTLNSEHAVWERVDDETRMTKLHDIIHEYERHTDKDGFVPAGNSTAPSRQAGSVEADVSRMTDHVLHHFRSCFNTSQQILSELRPAHIVITAPDHWIALAMQEFNMLEPKPKFVHGNYVRADRKHLLDVFHGALKPST